MATRMKKVNVSEPKDIDIEVDVEEEIVEKKKKRTFSSDDYIVCHSVTAGGLSVTGQSGDYYEFKSYGSENEIRYRDLVALVRMHSEHIFNPTLIIDDEDFLEEFIQVKKFYSTLFTDGDLKEILDMPVTQMTEAIKRLPEDVIPAIRTLAATDVAKGKIDSVKKIKALTEIFGSDFDLLSQLFGR